VTAPLTPEREQFWRAMARVAPNPHEWPEQADRYFVQGGIDGTRELLAELDRLRAERDEFCNRVDTLTAVAKGNKRHVREMFLELQKAQAALEEIRYLHKDSPMGPCPLCINADAGVDEDPTVPWPCPTARLAGAVDVEPSHVRAARYAAAGDEMAASLVRDGFGDDEIADILGRPTAPAAAQQPAEEQTACGKCKQPFDPADTCFDGAARYSNTPYCGRCVDRCHESTDAFHRCVICDTYETGE
jgi:hypothetical protein